MMSPPLWSSGEPVPSQLVSFGGNFLNFKSRARKGGCVCVGGGVACHQWAEEATAVPGTHIWQLRKCEGRENCGCTHQ